MKKQYLLTLLLAAVMGCLEATSSDKDAPPGSPKKEDLKPNIYVFPPVRYLKVSDISDSEDGPLPYGSVLGGDERFIARIMEVVKTAKDEFNQEKKRDPKRFARAYPNARISKQLTNRELEVYCWRWLGACAELRNASHYIDGLHGRKKPLDMILEPVDGKALDPYVDARLRRAQKRERQYFLEAVKWQKHKWRNGDHMPDVELREVVDTPFDFRGGSFVKNCLQEAKKLPPMKVDPKHKTYLAPPPRYQGPEWTDYPALWKDKEFIARMKELMEAAKKTSIRETEDQARRFPNQPHGDPNIPMDEPLTYRELMVYCWQWLDASIELQKEREHIASLKKAGKPVDSDSEIWFNQAKSREKACFAKAIRCQMHKWGHRGKIPYSVDTREVTDRPYRE